MQKHLGLPSITHEALNASLDKKRVLHDFGAPSDEQDGHRDADKKTRFTFSADGTELHMGWDTPRPWTHVIANECGYGVVLNNEGELYSFMGNSQQNGITPFSLNNVPVQVPGQALYLHNMESGALNSPTFLPFRRKDESCDITFGRGYAVYRKEAPGLDLEYTVFVLPDEPAEVRLLKIRNKSVPPPNLAGCTLPADHAGRNCR